MAFNLNDDIASLCPVKENGSQLSKNRVGISLVNIERETTGGIQFKQQATGTMHSRKTAPSWHLSLYILITVIFSDKQYTESLQLLSGILSFLQKNYLINIQATGMSVSVEPVNLSFQEQSNLWSINGSNYFPSILCKIRMLTIDEQEVADLSTLVSSPETTPKLKS